MKTSLLMTASSYADATRRRPSRSLELADEALDLLDQAGVGGKLERPRQVQERVVELAEARLGERPAAG